MPLVSDAFDPAGEAIIPYYFQSGKASVAPAL